MSKREVITVSLSAELVQALDILKTSTERSRSMILDRFGRMAMHIIYPELAEKLKIEPTAAED